LLSDDELKQLGIFFEDRIYGDLIFLMNPAIQIVPSYMGNKRMPGLHGFHPSEADSCACLLSNRPLPDDLTRIHHIYRLMERDVLN
jgi:hypothetical protein